MKTFRGLSLEPETAFRQIALLLEAGVLIKETEKEDGSDIADCVFIIARQYAEAAHDCALESQK